MITSNVCRRCESTLGLIEPDADGVLAHATSDDCIDALRAQLAAVDAACLEVCRDNTVEVVDEPDPELGRYLCLNENGDELIDTNDPAHVVRRLTQLWTGVSEKLEETLDRLAALTAAGEPTTNTEN